MREVLRDEFKYLFGGKIPLALIIFLLPLGFSVAFGFAYEKNVINGIPLIILDESQTKTSRQLVQMYDDSQKFRVVGYASTQEEVDAALKSGDAVAALEIPKDFAKNIRLQQGTEVLFTINSANNMFGSSAVTSVKEIQRSFGIAVAQKLLETQLLPADAMTSVYPVKLGVRILGDPTIGYSPFMLAGLMLNGLQIGILLILSPALVEELFEKKFPQSPAISIVVGKLVPCWLCGIVSSIISMAVVCRCFDVPMRGGFPLTIILLSTFLFFVSGAIVFFSACSPMVIMAPMLPLLYIMPGLLYSGVSYPLFDMNEIAYTFSRMLPISHTAENLRDLSLMGYAPNLLNDLKFMFAGGTLFIIVATIIFSLRRKLRIKKDVEVTQA